MSDPVPWYEGDLDPNLRKLEIPLRSYNLRKVMHRIKNVHWASVEAAYLSDPSHALHDSLINFELLCVINDFG